MDRVSSIDLCTHVPSGAIMREEKVHCRPRKKKRVRMLTTRKVQGLFKGVTSPMVHCPVLHADIAD